MRVFYVDPNHVVRLIVQLAHAPHELNVPVGLVAGQRLMAEGQGQGQGQGRWWVRGAGQERWVRSYV